MPTLLRINSSARLTGSYSRALGDHFEAEWRAKNPQGIITTRDLAKTPIEQIRQPTITGFYTPPEQLTPDLVSATALSDRLVAELQSATEVLLTVPIYNFSVPSALKAWIDQVVRIDHTFAYDGQNFSGLVKADMAHVICAYGANGYLDDGPLAQADFLRPYLAFLLGFIGISQVRFVGIEATTADQQTIAANFDLARQHIDAMFAPA